MQTEVKLGFSVADAWALYCCWNKEYGPCCLIHISAYHMAVLTYTTSLSSAQLQMNDLTDY